jgi:glycosyltransferase involved in cell wall biosynthesis
MEQVDQKRPIDVTVLVMFYNHADFVDATLDSIFNQHGVSLQVIITDDFSNDGTRDRIIEKTRGISHAIVDTIFPKENIGIPALFIEAIRLIKGKYFVAFGGDDLMHPSKLMLQSMALDEDRNASACYHDARAFKSDSDETLFYYSSKRKYMERLTVVKNDVFLDSARILPQTVMYRSDNIKATDIDCGLGYAFDIIFSIAATKTGPIIPIQGILVDYRRHENSITNSEEFANNIYRRLSLVYEAAHEKFPELQPKIDKAHLSVQALMKLRKFKRLLAERPLKAKNLLLELKKVNLNFRQISCMVRLGLIHLQKTLKSNYTTILSRE